MYFFINTSFSNLGGHGISDTFLNLLEEWLRSRYKETRYIPEEKEWPPNQPKYYVNLAVIHYQGSRTQEEVIFHAKHNEFINFTSDKIPLFNQVTREIADLFLADPHTGQTDFPKSILIEGAPGIGKTILLKEIAYRWANGTILDNARIVFLIYLRDSRFQSVTTINELIQYFDCLDENEIPAVVKQLKQSSGEGVVFLIDGLDEYPGALQNTFLVDLINRTILSKCLFVITSRPFASLSLHNKVERRIEIIGFGNEEQDEYICNFLKASSKKKEELDNYLQHHPMLSGLIYIPFHLSVLLFLFQQGNLPETLTEMNESFILHTVYRHMEKHDLPTSCIVKLDNFPKVIYDIIYKLSKLAFEGLQKNQLVFTFNEIKQTCPEVDTTPGAFNGFGLLQAVQHYPIKGAGTTVSFNFLHLTMQEFLAAWYISHCSIEEQKQLLNTSFMKCNFTLVKEYNYFHRISQNVLKYELDRYHVRVWQMYVGIVGAHCDAWVQFTTERSYALSEIKDPVLYLYFLQCMLEGKCKNVNLITSPFKNNTIKFPSYTLLPYHIALLCLFLSKSTEQWKYYNFHDNKMGDAGVKILTEFLLINEKILACIDALDLSLNNLSLRSSTAINNVIQRGTLVTLNLSCNKLGNSFLHGFSQILQANSTLKELVLCLNNIGVTGAKSIAVALHHNRTLEHLVISFNEIMDDGLIAISECFKISGGSNTKLICIKDLDLSANCLTSHSKYGISSIIQEGALVSLDLSYSKLDESCLYEISKSLLANLTLKQLFLCGSSIGVGGALSLAVALQHNNTIEDLCIRGNEILDNGTIAIAECLKTNRTLKSLNISKNNFTETGTTEIAEALNCNLVFRMLRIDREYVDILKQKGNWLTINEVKDKYNHTGDFFATLFGTRKHYYTESFSSETVIMDSSKKCFHTKRVNLSWYKIEEKFGVLLMLWNKHTVAK